MPRKLFVTTALPYANAPFHIGHMMEYIQADIWVRFQRMQGHEVHFVCADDAHGAAIMIAAEKAGQTPQAFVAGIAAGRKQYLDGFHISFDNWHSTDGPENHELAQDIYRALRKQGLIAERSVEQFFDPVKGMFLPDRYILGECPKCGTKDQYGDNCDHCGAVYSPTDLKNPVSALSGATPVRKVSTHYFFQLSAARCIEFLQQWTATPGRLQPEVLNKIREWFATDELGHVSLADWDISRDAPYFGIRIPDTDDKYFYVWLDAPVGYLASLKNYFGKGGARAAGEPMAFDAFMADPAVEQIHFIGKDISYFHTLFWPAMLHFSGRKTPDKIYVHGFITLGGDKMSKSRGTGLSPLRYLDVGLNAEWLRYYIAAKLNAKVEDIEFNPEDFIARINSDLIGKYINIASRAAGFLAKRFDGRLSADLGVEGRALLRWPCARPATPCANCYEEREFGKALREVMLLADRVNEFVDQHRPWDLAKQPGMDAALHDVCSVCIEAFRILTVYLKPVLPALAAEVEAFLDVTPLDWHARLALTRRAPHRRLPAPDAACRRQAGRSLVRSTRSQRRPLPGGEALAAGDQDRRLRQDRPAHREDRQCRTGRGQRQAAAPDAGCRRRKNAQRLLRHQERLQAGGPRRQADGGGRQPGAAQDEVRPQRRHGPGRQPRRRKVHPGLYVLEPWPGAVPGLRVR